MNIRTRIANTITATRVFAYLVGYWAGYQVGKWTHYWGERQSKLEWLLFLLFVFLAGICFGTLLSIIL